jgi:hypothetical protein
MDIASERLTRTFLAGSPWKTAREVVRALGAVQSQDYDGAKWAVGQRSTATDEAIEREFTSGAILRTHVLRPTWHFVDPLDIRWMLKLTGPRVARIMSTYDRKFGLSETVYKKSIRTFAKSLRDNNYLTRVELKERLARVVKFDTLDVQRMMRLVMRAELDGVICSGPRRGKQFTYALLDERAPAVPVRDRDEDLLDLTMRYFNARSPATAHDFGWWSGLVMGDVKRGIDLAGKQLERVDIDGKTYWRAGAIPDAPPPSAHLLPNYDEFFIGYRDRGAIGKRLGHIDPVTGGSTLIAHVFALDGQLVGGWKRTIDSKTVTVEAKLLTRLSSGERGRLMDAIARYEAFVQRKAKVNWTASKPKARTR